MVRMPFVHRMIMAERTIFQKLGWTLAAVAAATALRWIIDRGASGVPFVTYFPAVVLVALFVGWRWGCLTAVLAAIVGNRLFRPDLPITEFGPADYITAGLFALSCAILINMGHAVRRLLRQLDEARAREKLLNEELRHRGRNFLAVIHSIASLTYRSSPPEDFLHSFGQRLDALARANDIAEGNAPVALARIVTEAIAPFQLDSRIRCEGPEVMIGAEARIPAMLALHELCTNATKYGALSCEGGWIDVHWIRAGDGARILWRERGGPLVVPPTRKGLGSALLRGQRGMPSVDLRYPAEGVECDLLVTLA